MPIRPSRPATAASRTGRRWRPAAALGSLAAGNYSFSFANGTLTVTPATLTVTADDKSREYGDANPSFTAGYAGFKNGETLATSGVTGSPSLTTAATATSSVAGGPYAIVAALGSLAAGNYSFSFCNGQLTVTKATLTVSADDKTRVYGDANPSFTASYSGFKMAVTPATLTVTADDKSREYGDANPSFTAGYAGFKNGETLATSGVTGSPSLTTAATATSSVAGGPYAIVAALGSLAAGNYSFSFVNGQLTVTKATLTVSADDKTRVYGDANPSFTASYSGFKNGETLAT